MKPLVYLLLPLALLLAYGAGVLFWALVSQLRFESYFRGAESRPPRLVLRQWISFYRRTLAGAYLLLWWAIRAAFHTRLRQPAGPVQGRPVLCVHGLFMNSTCMWGIRRRLESMGRPTRAVFMGVPLPTPLAYTGRLTKAMQELSRQFPDDGFDVVAHSIGGVMIREVLSRQPELAGSLHHIVTLGSPHDGTATVRWIRHGPIYRMLSLGSPYLRRLATFRDLAPSASAITIASQHDLVVYPWTTCHLAGTRQIDLTEISHIGLMTDARALDEVERALAAGEPGLESSADLG